MFENLGWTFRREPVLYVSLAVALGNLVRDYLAGGVTLEALAIGVVTLVLGFVARGKVSPA